MEIPDRLLYFSHAEIQDRGDSYVIEFPKNAVRGVNAGDVFRVALLPSILDQDSERASEQESASRSNAGRGQQAANHPVENGEIVDVEIEDLGEQGDGIARIGPGFVIIVPDTKLNERVAVRITDVRPTLAFAEVVKRYDQK